MPLLEAFLQCCAMEQVFEIDPGTLDVTRMSRNIAG